MGQKKQKQPVLLEKQPLWPPSKGRIAGLIVGLCLLLILVVGGVLLQPENGELTAAQKRNFASARVTDILADDAQPDEWTEGLRVGSQYLEYVISIPNYDRGIVLVGMLVVFALLLILIGGKKGVMALLGLAYTLAGIWFLLIPMVLKGAPSIPSAIFIAALTAAASLLMLTGFSRKTLCAGLGCVCGVAAAGLFAWIVGIITPIGGFNMSEAEELVLRAYDSPLEIRGLLVSGILIAALGAVMDVAMSISSACHELRVVDPEITSGRLFRSGMNIGRDAMGTMANTLILAFAGASFNMLLLFQVYHYPLIQIINSDTMAIELIQSVAGSVGIILTVPLVSLFASLLLGKKKKRAG